MASGLSRSEGSVTPEETLADAIQRAMATEIQARRETINAGAGQLVSVTLAIRLQDTPDPVRSVEWTDQRIVARKSRLR